ncbi:MAG: hypothetical protein IJI21_07800 [Clostridia bacterium]|nr:hypothetical protein [Clostridia bacterium]
MFGSRTKELSSLLTNTKLDLEKMTEEKNRLEKELGEAKAELKELKDLIGDSDIRTLEEKAKATIAEYEGLKELYNTKIRTFEDAKIEEEQNFARESALKRHALENEIAANRKNNEEFVTSTVGSFTETYNYYLNQIKVLMDALGHVAQQTGQTLFEGDTENLKANFSQQLADALKSGTDKLEGDEGELIVIGASEGDMDMLEVRALEPDAEGAGTEKTGDSAFDDAEKADAASGKDPGAEHEADEAADEAVMAVDAAAEEAWLAEQKSEDDPENRPED